MNSSDQIGMSKLKKRKGTETIPFKNILGALMKERSLTIRQVAGLAGVNPSVVQNWLEGKNPHDLQAVSKLSLSLGVSFKSLLLGEPDEGSKQFSLSEQYEEQEFFDGLASITIKRLIPRKSKK